MRACGPGSDKGVWERWFIKPVLHDVMGTAAYSVTAYVGGTFRQPCPCVTPIRAFGYNRLRRSSVSLLSLRAAAVERVPSLVGPDGQP